MPAPYSISHATHLEHLRFQDAFQNLGETMAVEISLKSPSGSRMTREQYLFHFFVVLCLDSSDLNTQVLLKLLHPSIRVRIADKVDSYTLPTESSGSS